jgi:hypothetical protein
MTKTAFVSFMIAKHTSAAPVRSDWERDHRTQATAACDGGFDQAHDAFKPNASNSIPSPSD